MSGPSGPQLAALRIALGGLLAFEFAAWIPHAGLLLQVESLVPLDTPFPSVLDACSSTSTLRVLLAGASAVALLYAAGVRRRLVAPVLWYAWACLVERCFFVQIPSDGYVGWLLLATALIPEGESLREDPHAPRRVPRELVLGAWCILALSYTASGIDKWSSPSWRSGDALATILGGPLASPLGAWVVGVVPPGWFELLTWGSLVLECGYAPLCLLSRARPWAWLAAVVLHLGVLALLEIRSVSLAMLIFHGFTFEPTWLSARAAHRLPQVSEERAQSAFEEARG